MVQRAYSHRKSGPRRPAQQSPSHPQQYYLLGRQLIQWMCKLDPLMVGLLLAAALSGSYNNFKASGLGRYKPCHEVAIYLIEMFIGLLCIDVDFHEWVIISPCPRLVRIFRETEVIVILSYVLLVDINLSYLWLFIFPGITILFIHGLSNVLADRGKVTSSTDGCTDTESDDEKTIRTPVGLTLMVMVPFLTLLVMVQLPDHAADRFAISQFLLFMSTTLAALTRMMRMLSPGMPRRVAQASELLHKISLLVLLVTAHTVAAELLGVAVVLICMLEVGPVLLWFSIHLDRECSVISVHKLKKYRNLLVPVVCTAIPLEYLKTPTGVSLLSSKCATISVSCLVSGILTYYLVFMLRQWPGQQADEEEVVQAEIQVAKSTGFPKEAVQSENQAAKGRGCIVSPKEAVRSKNQAAKGKGIVSSKEAVQSKNQAAKGKCRIASPHQSENQAGKGKHIGSSEKIVQAQNQANSYEEAVQLLEFWAYSLLMAACLLALLLLFTWLVLPKFSNSYSLPSSKQKYLLPPVTLTSMLIF